MSMPQVPRAHFDHVGIPVDDERPGEIWFEDGRLWVSSPRNHPFHVEWLRFAPDSPMHGAVKSEPHVAFRVDDLDKATEGQDVLMPPFDVGHGFMRVAFIRRDGALIELMQYRDPDEEGWF